jgi:hypothetical protein|tara:strand:- start:4112 stop:4684 length:573 start_codon:yes stop_codon:yes gene_type:complete
MADYYEVDVKSRKKIADITDQVKMMKMNMAPMMVTTAKMVQRELRKEFRESEEFRTKYGNKPLANYIDINVSSQGAYKFKVEIAPTKKSGIKNLKGYFLLAGRRGGATIASKGNWSMRAMRSDRPLEGTAFGKTVRQGKMKGHHDRVLHLARQKVGAKIQQQIFYRLGLNKKGGGVVRKQIGGRVGLQPL